MNLDETKIEKYIKFVEKQGHLINDQYIGKFRISSIFERRELSKKFEQKSW